MACERAGSYPRFEGGQAEAHADGGLVGVDNRVVVDVTVVAHSDGLVVILLDAVEGVDWLCERKRRGLACRQLIGSYNEHNEIKLGCRFWMLFESKIPPIIPLINQRKIWILSSC